MNGGVDPRVLELCSQIASETDHARMLKLITELNLVLQQSAAQSEQDTPTMAAD
jgi:hypothetical protein